MEPLIDLLAHLWPK